MAKIITMSDKLTAQYHKYRKRTILWYVLCGIAFVSFGLFGAIVVPLTFSLLPMFPIMGAFLLFGALGARSKQKADAYKAGVEGEIATASIIASLPQNYVGIRNLEITYEGQKSELDMVVIGPTGVFIIETKNTNGTIVGHYDNPQWTQKKIGQNGTPYSKNFYNPVKQVGTHVYRLAHLLRANKFNVHVNAMVYFANPDAAVQVIGSVTNVPVLSAIANGAMEILGFILNTPACMTDEQVNAAVSFLCDGALPSAQPQTTPAPVVAAPVTQPTQVAPTPAPVPVVAPALVVAPTPAAQPVSTPVVAPAPVVQPAPAVAPAAPTAPAQPLVRNSFCTKCGAKLQSEAHFCTICGNKVR